MNLPGTYSGTRNPIAHIPILFPLEIERNRFLRGLTSNISSSTANLKIAPENQPSSSLNAKPIPSTHSASLHLNPSPSISSRLSVPNASHFQIEHPLGKIEIPLIVTGMGAKAIRRSVETIAPFRPDYLILVGFAGSLTDTITIGQVVLATETISLSNRSTQFEWLPPLTIDFPSDLLPEIRRVRCLTSDRIITSSSEKKSLCQQFGADIVDMESYAFVDSCQKFNIRPMVLRAISDSADQDLAPRWSNVIRADGTISIFHLLQFLIYHPLQITKLIQLHRQSQIAGENLANSLYELIDKNLKYHLK